MDKELFRINIEEREEDVLVEVYGCCNFHTANFLSNCMESENDLKDIILKASEIYQTRQKQKHN